VGAKLRRALSGEKAPRLARRTELGKRSVGKAGQKKEDTERRGVPRYAGINDEMERNPKKSRTEFPCKKKYGKGIVPVRKTLSWSNTRKNKYGRGEYL
jgi:hypothetical protein